MLRLNRVTIVWLSVVACLSVVGAGHVYGEDAEEAVDEMQVGVRALALLENLDVVLFGDVDDPTAPMQIEQRQPMEANR